MSAEKMHSQNHPASFQIAALALVFVLLAPVLYVFSVGPVAYLANAAQLPNDNILLTALSAFYFPLEWISEHNQTAEAFFEWYINLWDI
jgi:hypothetical protein